MSYKKQTKRNKRKQKVTKKGTTKKTKRNKNKITGGGFDIRPFIEKLKEIKSFIDSNKGRVGDLELVNMINAKFQELIHIKEVKPDYPSLEEHANNVGVAIHLFEEKSKENPNLYNEVDIYNSKNSFPSTACFDYKVSWLMTFLIGTDCSITSHNKSSKTAEIIGKIIHDACELLRTTGISRREYEKTGRFTAVRSKALSNIDIDKAINSNILSREEFETIFTAATEDYFDNKMLTCNGVDIPEPRTKEIIIDTIPVPIIHKGSILFAPDGNKIGEVKFDQYYVFYLNVITDKSATIKLVPGMRLVVNE